MGPKRVTFRQALPQRERERQRQRQRQRGESESERERERATESERGEERKGDETAYCRDI